MSRAVRPAIALGLLVSFGAGCRSIVCVLPPPGPPPRRVDWVAAAGAEGSPRWSVDLEGQVVTGITATTSQLFLMGHEWGSGRPWVSARRTDSGAPEWSVSLELPADVVLNDLSVGPSGEVWVVGTREGDLCLAVISATGRVRHVRDLAWRDSGELEPRIVATRDGAWIACQQILPRTRTPMRTALFSLTQAGEERWRRTLSRADAGPVWDIRLVDGHELWVLCTESLPALDLWNP